MICIILSSLIVGLTHAESSSETSHNRVLWYHRSAMQRVEALPKGLAEGSVTGLCARGGFDVDITWKNGILVTATIRSKAGSTCRVRYGNHKVKFETSAGEAYRLDNKLNLHQ
jgi:alpha-L-fucosidase 2